MKQYAIGLDNGGTVIKAALFDVQGHEICVASRKTPVYSPKPGYIERDMEQLWDANCECIAQVIRDSGVDADQIIGIAVCGHGKGLYLWDDGKPVRGGIVSTDNRAWRYPLQWKEDGTFDKLYPQLCQQLLACQQVSLLRWMKDHEPENYQAIRWVFSVKDYVRFRLTGEAYAELTDISGSGLLDVSHSCYSRQMLEALGIGEMFDKLPPLKSSTDYCGSITPEAAAKTGLPVGTPVAGGMFDIDACAVAMGMTSTRELCTVTGTWSINLFTSEKPILGSAVAMNSLYAMPEYYLLEECSATSAGNLDWFLDQFYQDSGLQGQQLYAHVNQQVASVSPEDCDVYYLPFLYGSNTHELAKATFAGLTQYHGKQHMLRAIFEGVAYSAKSHIDKLLTVRETPEAIRLAGGVVNSPLWIQMFADVLGIPIATVDGVKEIGALGCAMAACIAAGVYPDYRTAAQHMITIHAPVQPDPERHAVYRRKYEKYTALTRALDTVWGQFTV